MTDPDATRIDHPDAPTGKASKYARIERERRFLLRALPSGVVVRRVRIEDRYVLGTRLRLRMATDLATGRIERKLVQKIPAPDGGPGLVTNLYLSADEHDALRTIPAATLAKVRSSIPPFGVDEFEGPLAGLVLAEVEFDDDDTEAAFEPPGWAIAEVTRGARFTGGRLCSMTEAESL